MSALTRRTVLRGAMHGAAIVVGLPFLDCFLNSHGTALAATGEPLPSVFGTWFQHLGLNPGMWEPKKVGAGYENNVQLKALDPYRDKLNIYSGMKYFVEGRPLQTHTTGSQIATTGRIPVGTDGAPSIDSLIADVIGTRTRFRSLEVAFDGSTKSYSQRSGTSVNRSEPSPAALYKRIFVDGFKDPNAADFTPDPMVMAQESVLSSVSDNIKDTISKLGAADRARLDEYFTSLRQFEKQLALQLERPAPLPACRPPASAPQEAALTTILEDAAQNCRLFGQLLAYAAACGQTRVFNVMVGSQDMRKAGTAYTWHTATHEESIDEKLGYQKDVFAFNAWANQAFLDFVRAIDGVREGAGTVLDRTLILWLTDHSDARVHGLDKVPVMTFGSGGGRIKTGIHVNALGDPVTRVGLTVQQAFGVRAREWGENGNLVSKPIGEVMA